MADLSKLNEELDRLRSNGMVLPRHPGRAVEAYKGSYDAYGQLQNLASADLARGSMRLGRTITSDNYESPEVQRILQENNAMARAMGSKRATSSRMQRQSMVGGSSGVGGDVYNAIPRFYDPLEYWDLSGLPWNVQDEGHRHKLHKWLRLYYATHYLVPLLVDVFTRFPLAGLEINSKDPYIVDFYEDLFLNQLDYEEFLVSLGRDFWVVGECFSLGSFDEDLGVWEREELINPEDIVIENFPMLGTQQLKIVPPDYLKKLAQLKQPAKEWRLLEMNYPDLIPYLRRGEHIPISPVLLRQVANKLNDWDDHGTPILLRGLRTLLHEEKLLASQDAIAERLYSPLILAKLGIQDMGDGMPPFIPGPEELDSVRDDFDIALSSDFRLMVHHFGLEVSSVFGREQMPRLGDDFDRIEKRLMQCLSGDTLVHTIEGLKPIKELSGRTLDVLSLGGVYRPAQWDYYGKQEIYQVVLDNGDIIEATAGHEWLVCQNKPKHKRLTTKDLVGRRIPMQYLANDFEYSEDEWREGAQHGLVYGDGWNYLDGRYTMVRQHGDNSHLIPDLFEKWAIHKINHTSSGYATTAQSLPRHWKTLPGLDKSPSYLRGFIAGFIASDGSVDDTGHVEIAQADLACLQHVRELAKKAQLPTIDIQDVTENIQKHNPKARDDGEYFELSFAKAAFFLSDEKGYDPHLILKDDHRKLAQNCHQGRHRWSSKVVAVISTGRIEDVYCCVEPETHSFVIENCYLTGNCFGANPSLFSAGSGGQPYASSALQAEFLNQMLRTFQNMLKKHFKERASVVAEAQEHFDYEIKGSTRVPVYETIVEWDMEGNKTLKEVPKLLIPELDFSVLDIRDEATERQFLQTLRGMGVPIPDADLMVGIHWDLKDKINTYNKELKEKTISQQQAKMDTYTALTAMGLPVPADLRAEVESVLQAGTPGAPGGAPPGGGVTPGVSGPGEPPAGGAGEGTVMPNAPAGLLGPGPGTAPPGGGAPPAGPVPPGPRGTVPEVSNERRPGLTYNTRVARIAPKKGSDWAQFNEDHPELGIPFWDYAADHNSLDRDNGELDDLPLDEIERLHEDYPQHAGHYTHQTALEIAAHVLSLQAQNDVDTLPEEESTKPFKLARNQELKDGDRPDGSEGEWILESKVHKRSHVELPEDKKRYSIVDPEATSISEEEIESEPEHT